MALGELIEEAMEKHREIKSKLLDLSARASMPNMTKEKIKDELFKLYLEIK